MSDLYRFKMTDESLSHHGIEGQKWGVKNGPPYPLDASDHSAAEKKHMGYFARKKTAKEEEKQRRQAEEEEQKRKDKLYNDLSKELKDTVNEYYKMEADFRKTDEYKALLNAEIDVLVEDDKKRGSWSVGRADSTEEEIREIYKDWVLDEVGPLSWIDEYSRYFPNDPISKKANELNAKSKELQRKIKSETGKDPDYRYLILT